MLNTTIADGFAVVGFRNSMEDAIQDNNQNLERFMQHYEEKHMWLNSEKLRLCEIEVPFIDMWLLVKDLKFFLTRFEPF